MALQRRSKRCCAIASMMTAATRRCLSEKLVICHNNECVEGHLVRKKSVLRLRKHCPKPLVLGHVCPPRRLLFRASCRPIPGKRFNSRAVVWAAAVPGLATVRASRSLSGFGENAPPRRQTCTVRAAPPRMTRCLRSPPQARPWTPHSPIGSQEWSRDSSRLKLQPTCARSFGARH